MNISLPAPLKAFVDDQVSQRGYSTSSEYVRELIRKDQDRQHLRSLLLACAESAPTAPADGDYFDSLRPRARKVRGMKAKPVIPRALANQVVEGAIVYHLEQRAALGFIDALEQAYAHISLHPASGTGRYAHELELPGLL